MSIWVAKFQREGYKIRPIFGLKLTHQTFKVYFLCQNPLNGLTFFY